MRHTCLAAAAVVFALSACGTVGTGLAPNPTPTIPDSTSPIGTGYDLVVTEQDHSVTMRVGQTVDLVLHSKTGMTNWANVRSQDPGILMPIVDRSGTAIRGVTLTAFEAVAPGHTVVTASAGALCSPGQACPMYAVLLSIQFTVTG